MVFDKNYNIILLLIDGARFDRLNQSDDFKEVLSMGTMFSKMCTYAPYTLASMAAIFSGMYGSRNGINAYSKMFKHRSDVKYLAEYLQEKGFFTTGDAMRLSLVSERGFDKLVDHDERNTDYIKAHKRIIDEALESKESNNPFFLYLHYPKIHTALVENVFEKYDDFSPEYFENKEKNLNDYDGYLKEAGKYLGEIMRKIKKHDLIDNSIIIVMADHGMGVGEKIGERAYGVYTYDYSIMSFASFINPKLFEPGRKINKLTRTIDIMPTILEILKIEPDPNFLSIQGQSLMEFIKPETFYDRLRSKFWRGRISFSETGGVYGPWPSPDKPNVKCIRTENWKLIYNLEPDTWELYNLELDPLEKKNLYDAGNSIARKLKKELKKIINNN